jgi:hypothetical protein
MTSKYQGLAAIALWWAAVGPAAAGPADYVHTPTVEQGEREFEFRYGSSGLGADEQDQAAVLGLGYGVTDFWFTEAYVKAEDPDPGGWGVSAFEWENKFQLTETGKYPVEVGLLTEIEVPREGDEAREFKFGPLFQGDVGKLQLNANLLFESKFGGDGNGEDAGNDTEIGYEVQAKYRWRRAFEFGVQGFGDMGPWNDWEPASQQIHRFGPAIFGKIGLGGRQALKYNAAVLFGLTDASPNDTFRLQVEYEF